MTPSLHPSYRLLARLALSGLIVGCGGGDDTGDPRPTATVTVAASATPSSSPRAARPTATAAPATATASLATGIRLDIGDYRLWVRCWGADGPTVVLIAPGVYGDAREMTPLGEEVAAFTRVCVYDRGSLGRSDDGPPITDMQQIAEELHALVAATGETQPVVLAGYSFGGGVAQLYASTFPDAVAGMVLIDPSVGEGLARATSDMPVPILGNVDFAKSADQLINAGPWPDVPLIVITSGILPADAPDEALAYMLSLHDELAQRTSHGKQVIAEHSEHANLLINDLDLVVDSIHEVVEQVRE